jgi:hypothetical protein
MSITPIQLITQYISYFNRAPDPEGFAYWLRVSDEQNLTLVQLARQFSDSDEAQDIYPLLGTPGFLTEARVETFLEDVYQNLFNRGLDAGGRDFYVPDIVSGALAVEEAIAQIINGAKGGDEQVLNNKAAAAQIYVDTFIDDANFSYLDPDGTPNAEAEALAKSVVANTDGTPESIDDAQADIDAYAASLSNEAPTATDDTALASEDDALTVPAAGVLANDTDPESGTLTVTAVNGAEGDVGTAINLDSGAVLTLNADGSYTYDPNGKFEDLTEGQFKTDTFEYTVSDEFGASDTATVTVKIEGKADENTFTLTAGADTSPEFDGDSADDIYVGTEATLSSADSLNGGKGEDLLDVSTDGGETFGAFGTTSVEIIETTADNGTTTYDLSGTSGVTTLRSENSDSTVVYNQATGLAALEMVNLTEAGGGVAPDFTVAFQDGVVAGADDAISLTTNGSNVGTVTVGSTSDADGGVERIDLEALGSDSKIDLLDSDIATLGFSGDKSVVINQDLPGTLTAIDGGGATGSMTATVDSANDADVTLGAGDDNITHDSLGANDTVDLGEGEDTLEAAEAGLIASSANGGINNVEIIEIQNTFSNTIADAVNGFQADNFPGATTFQLESGFNDGTVINDLAPGQRVDLEAKSVGNTLNLDDAAFTNADDSFTIGVGESDGQNGLGASAGTVDFSSNATEMVTIDSRGDNDTVNTPDADQNVLSVFNGGLETLMITGDEDLQLQVNWTQGAASSLTAIDASAANGDLDLDEVLYEAGSSVSVTGGSGGDILAGGANDDTIVGNAGNDLIGAGAGADTVDAGEGDDNAFAGAGADTFTLGAGADGYWLTQVSDSQNGGGQDTVTDFTSGEDQIYVRSLMANNGYAAGQFAFVGSFGSFGAAQGAVFNGSGILQSVFDTSTNTLYFDVDDDGTLNNNDVAVILSAGNAPVATDFESTTFAPADPSASVPPVAPIVGNTLETTGATFNTVNGFNILNGTTVTGADDTITVVDNGHLITANLEGQGGTDTAIFNEGTTYDLANPASIGGMENLVLESGSDLRATDGQLSSFTNITGASGFNVFFAVGSITIQDGGVNLAGFERLEYDGSGQTIDLDLAELPFTVDFNDAGGAASQDLDIHSAGSTVIDLSVSNRSLIDFGAGGTIDEIDVDDGGTLRIDGSNTGNFANAATINIFGNFAAGDTLQTEGDLDVTAFVGIDSDLDLQSVGTNVDIIDDGASRSITGDAGNNIINGAGGNDEIDGGAGVDLIMGGTGTDTIDLGAIGDVDTVSVGAAGADGADRNIVSNFETGLGGDVFNVEAAAGGTETLVDLSGTDNFLTTNSIQDVNSTGNITADAETEVIRFTAEQINGDLTTITDPNVLGGEAVLNAIGGTFSPDTAGDSLLFLIGDTAGNTGVYLADDANSGGLATAGEITLIGVLDGVSVNSLTVDNFSNNSFF